MQAVTIGRRRQPASAAVVYRAARAALDLAEVPRIRHVASYLTAIRLGYAVEPPMVIVDALVDCAGVTTSIRRMVLCETGPKRISLAIQAVQNVTRGVDVAGASTMQDARAGVQHADRG